MATIKSYTDLGQSKKLAEILPLESADMYYTLEDFVDEDTGDVFSVEKISFGHPSNTEIGCWSLAALLGVLPNGIVMNKDSQTGRYHFSSTHVGTYVTADNPIDACYELILKLHELNLL